MKKILLLMTMILTCVGTWAQTPVVHVSNIGTAPFQLSDEDAAKIFELDNLTVVLDVTTAASLSGRGAFFCVADPAQAVPGSFSGTNTSYMACGHVNASIAYIAAAKDGQHFSTGTIPANSTIRIAYVFDKTNNKFKAYIGDTNTGWTMDRNFGTYEIATPKMVKEDFENAKIYIGGGMANNEAHETGDATIHRVSVYEGALSVEQIKSLSFLPIKAEVVGDLRDNNPNTHFGRITATTGTNVKTTLFTTANMTVSEMSYNGIGDVISFTRPYRGFTFQGFYLGEQNLGKSFTLTEAQKNAITKANPLVAKFTTTDDVTLFYDDDPFSYRIPAIATTSTGRIIAVSDYRYSLDDIGRYNFGTQNPGIDLVMRYSDNNGETWSETKTIAKGSGVRNADDCAYGDAAIAVVGEKVLVMAAAGDVMFGNGSATAHNRAVRLYSEDNGETWTKQDISETLFLNTDATINNGYSSFFGSGRLAVDENYNNTGKPRIYGALLLKKASGTGNYVIYTDDFGLTWSVLGGSQDPIANQDEPKVEILPSGQILLSVRRGGGRQFNVFTYTDKSTNEGSWDTNVNGCSNGGSNTCNGEPYCVDAKKADGSPVKLLLQSQPKGGSGLYDRRDVTIWYKEITDANYTSAQIAADWTQGIQVSTQLSAYSAMALQKDGKIAFFFEEAPCYDDNYAKGYCMVYTPLTIESITKANYFSPNTDLNAAKTINVELTDAQGNIYREQVECLINDVASDLTNKYPYITLGDKASFNVDGDIYTYTNTVTLPFKVSNANTTVWHNIYWPANTNENGYPVYLSASSAEDINVPKVTEAYAYGNSSYNTAANADKISWAIYNVGNGFTFKFQNKLTGKFIQVTSVASGNSQNAKYVDEADATAFELVPDAASYRGDYALKASVGGTVGYLCSTSATGYHYATHYSGNGHQGAWMKFAEAPDFTALIASINESLGMIGTGLGQYKVTDANATKAETAKTAMQNSGSVNLNELNGYTNLLDGATLNKPVDGQFFRIAYDNSTEKLYLQSLASSVKGVQFTAETGNTSIWLYHDGALYSYKAGQCLREIGDDRGLQAIGGKTNVTFTASPRTKGKYNIACTSYIHANSSNGNYFTDHCSGDGGHEAHDLILEEVTSLPITISAAKYATFYAPVAVAVPDGVTAYTVTVNGEWATLYEIESGVIPANTGVILGGEAAAYDLDITATKTTITDNDLLGTVAAQYVKDYAYVLGIKNGNLGLHKVVLNKTDSGAEGTTHFLNNAFKSYLPASAVPSAVKSLLFTFGETTNIEESVINTPLGKNAPIYDLSGRRVLSTMKGGIYIQNGKKFIVK